MNKFQARKRTQKTANHCLDNKKCRGSQKESSMSGEKGVPGWRQLVDFPCLISRSVISCLLVLTRSVSPIFFFFINTVNPFLNRSFPLRCTFCPYSFLFLLPFLFLSLLLSVSGSHWPIPHYTSTPFHFSTVPFNSLDHLNPQHLSLPPSEHYQVTPVELY